MQSQETFIVGELSEFSEISRRAVSKHIQKLDSSVIAKNERSYRVVLCPGVLQLTRNLGSQMLLDRLHEYEQDSDKNVNIPNKNAAINKLLNRLREENESSWEQFASKEQNNSHI